MAITTPPAPPRTLERSASRASAPTTSEPRLQRLRRQVGARRPRRGGDAVVLLPLLLATAVLMRIGLFTAPQRIDDEGTYVAQAWSVFHLGELTHYTYWYDHPPLGWLQIAAWTQVTGGFDRAPNAVGAGREFMLVLAVVGAALLWVLAKRLALPRWAAAVAVGLYAFSPLAVQFHRTVYLDNVATVWVLAAFVLVLSPSRRLGAFAAASVCLAVAILSKETSLLMAPVLGWLLWHRSRGETRRYAVAVSVSLFALVGVFYLLFAALKGEVLPGAGRTSLVGGALYQLGGRAGSGSIFTPGTLGNSNVRAWLDLDVVLPALALVATVLALAVRRLRPFAVAMLILLAMLVRPGYLPAPFVVEMLPLGALLVAGAVASGWQARPARFARPLGALAIAVALAVAASGAPGWGHELRSLITDDLDAPMTEATAWIAQNVPPSDRIVTDDALWVDLVEQGRARGDVVWFYKPDTDPAVPRGWQNYRWVVSTYSTRNSIDTLPTVADAVRHSQPEAVFGTGPRRVEVRRVLTSNPTAQQIADQTAAAATAGQQLVLNPSLDLTASARDDLLSGRVDPRLLTVLALSAASHQLAITALPAEPAERAAGAARRVLSISSVDGQPVSDTAPAVHALLAELRAQTTAFLPLAQVTRSSPGGDAVLFISFPLPTS